MRITTRLQIASIATIALLVGLAPVLVWTFIEFDKAKSDNQMANAIHSAFFERVSFRDQYFLYREDRFRTQWDKAKEASDSLLRAARDQFQADEDQRALERVGRAIDDSAVIFHRIVTSSNAFNAATDNREIYEELDKRLYSQLLLKGSEVRNALAALQNTSARRVQQAYENLSVISSLLAGLLALTIVVNTRQISGLIRKRLMSLHAGARRVVAGDLDFRIDIRGADEFADLARSINAVTDKLVAEINAHVKSQNALEQALDRLLNITSRVPGFILLHLRMRPDGSFCAPYANRALREIYRLCPDGIQEDASPLFACVHPEDLAPHLASIEASATHLTPWLNEYRLAFEGEPDRWMTANAVPQREADGSVIWYGFITDFTERKHAQQASQEALHRIQKIASRVPGLIYQFRLRPDGSSCFPFASEAIQEIYRVSPEEVREDASKIFSVIHPDDLAMGIASIRLSAQDLSPWQHEYRVKFDDGAVRWLMANAIPERESDGATLWNGFITDITERKTIEESLQLAASVFRHAREGITITSVDGTILDVNESFTRITGYSRDAVVGHNPRILNSGLQDPEFYAAMWRALVQEGHWNGEIWNRHRDGKVFPEMLTISAVRDARGRTLHYVALFSDITALKAHQQQLEQIAHFDVLTSLPNRLLLADRLQQALVQVARREQTLAVVYLDLDGFKAINDRHGHDAGDQLLIALASRMKQALREGDTLARLGGDEFVAVLIDLADAPDCVPMLARLLVAAAQPVQVGPLVLQVSASLGVAFYPQGQDVDADHLLRQADQAMYQAKLAGKNRYHIFDATQDDSIRDHHESLERIRRALNDGEFLLYYQPKVNMRTGQIMGVEALIRWQHPQLGLLAPALFLPAIEDHPLAVAVGEWVINAALSQIAVWLEAGLDMTISVNVGARQLQQPDFIDRLRAILTAHPQVSPCRLEFEILETSALEDIAQVSELIAACAQLGVCFALDDFGTGYSSLTYLKRLQVTMLKIDQSFVRDMLDDQNSLAILEGVIGLAAAFKRQVIAEGVETVAHGTLLLQLGCELAQGYGIARPMPAHELQQWSATWQPAPAWRELMCIGQEKLWTKEMPVAVCAPPQAASAPGRSGWML